MELWASQSVSVPPPPQISLNFLSPNITPNFPPSLLFVTSWEAWLSCLSPWWAVGLFS